MGLFMIFSDFLRAASQLGDPRFRRVVLLGILLALVLLVGVYALFLGMIQLWTPDTVTIPGIGPVGGLSTLLGWGSAFLMIGLSVFLMVPVAGLMGGLYLEDVAASVEDRHYPNLPPVTPAKLSSNLIEAVNFLGILIAVNLALLVAYVFAGPFIPLIFWAANGFLLGREFFTLVAARRLGRAGARTLRARHAGQIWLAGTLMAAPLSIPFVNLIIPVLGVATFTHMFHRLVRDQS
jgi:uncharacterized protein involved in cysteine biosynthesis